jgi:hypothetical protein
MKVRPNHCNPATNRQLPPHRPIRCDGGTRSTILQPGHASSPVSYWSSRSSRRSSSPGSLPRGTTVTFFSRWQTLSCREKTCRAKTLASDFLVHLRAGSGNTAVSTGLHVEIFKSSDAGHAAQLATTTMTPGGWSATSGVRGWTGAFNSWPTASAVSFSPGALPKYTVVADTLGSDRLPTSVTL